METITLSANIREQMGRKTDALRSEGVIPAVVYGLDVEPKNIQLARNAFDRVLKTAGESTVIELDVDGNKENVLIQDVQRDALTEFTKHVDFRRVDMNTKVDASISISVIGDAPAVTVHGGTLMQTIDEIDVRALPSDLVKEVEVDAAGLATFDDSLHVSDIQIPNGIEVLTDMDQVIATVAAPRVNEEPVVAESEEGETTEENEEEEEETKE